MGFIGISLPKTVKFSLEMSPQCCVTNAFFNCPIKLLHTTSPSVCSNKSLPILLPAGSLLDRPCLEGDTNTTQLLDGLGDKTNTELGLLLPPTEKIFHNIDFSVFTQKFRFFVVVV